MEDKFERDPNGSLINKNKEALMKRRAEKETNSRISNMESEIRELKSLLLDALKER